MASCASMEVLDLRHFAAPMLRPVLEAESELWQTRLHWDYRASVRLLAQYLDNHMLPGFAALDAGQVTGYAFCVYEETKAVVGDVFALDSPSAGRPLKQSGLCCCIFLNCCSTRRKWTALSLNCCFTLRARTRRCFATPAFRSSAASSWCGLLPFVERTQGAPASRA